MKGYKIIETLEVMFEKETSNSKTGKRENIYKTAFFNGKAKTITNAIEIESELSISRFLESSYINKRYLMQSIFGYQKVPDGLQTK